MSPARAPRYYQLDKNDNTNGSWDNDFGAFLCDCLASGSLSRLRGTLSRWRLLSEQPLLFNIEFEMLASNVKRDTLVISRGQHNNLFKWLLVTALVALGASKALAQCGVFPDGNIVLTVPEGGSVTSASGDFDCAEGQACDYTVSGQAFNETFTVTAAPGYFFLGWKGDSAASLCQNGGSPCAVSLPTAWPDVEPVHTLEPIFEVDYSWAPVSRSTDNIQLTDSETLPVNQNISIELEYFDNPDYSCGLSGNHTFEVLGPYNNANLNAPLWVYLHGGGAGYYDAGQVYRTQIDLDANAFNHEESFATLQELDPDHPATGSAQQDRTITRRISDRYRVLVVGYCDHDNYSGLGTPYPNNPTGGDVDGLQAAMAAIEYVATNYSTTDIFVHGTDAGSFGAWSVGQAFHQSGVNLTGLIMDSGIVTPRYDQILSEFTGDAGFPYGVGFDQQGLIDKIGIFANPAMPYHPEATVNAGFDAVPMLVVAGKLDPEAGGNQPAIPAASGAGQGNVEWLYDGLQQAVDAQLNSPHQLVLVDGVADAPTMRDVDDTANDAVDAFVSGVLAGNPPHPSFAVAPPSGIVGQRLMLMGHSFFRPFIDRLPFHVAQAGIVGHSQEKVTAGGVNGTPLSLWNNTGNRGAVQAVLDGGDVELFGMTCCDLERTPGGELVLDSEGNPNLLLDGYQLWFDYALEQNPDTAFFIGMPWIDFPTDYADATEYGDLWTLFYNTIILSAVDELRAQYPGVTIYSIPYGQASHELYKLFEAGNLPDVSNVQGSSATSLYTDYKGHAGDVLKALIELIWIDAIYGVDLDTYAYDPGYQTDLKALAKSIMDAHDPAYNGPNR
jgi:hypothetical protein